MVKSFSAAKRSSHKAPQATRILLLTLTLWRRIFRVDYEQHGSYSWEDNTNISIAWGVAQGAPTWTGFGPLSINPFALIEYNSHAGIWDCVLKMRTGSGLLYTVPYLVTPDRYLGYLRVCEKALDFFQRNHHWMKPVLVMLSREDDFRCLFSDGQISCKGPGVTCYGTS